MSKIKGDINCTHPVPLASAPGDETDVVRSVHVACLYRNDDSSVIEIAASLIYPHFTGCEIELIFRLANTGNNARTNLTTKSTSKIKAKDKELTKTYNYCVENGLNGHCKIF